jgi:phosphoribosylaminoimidazolecarboxamide formyltransferase/IMP cyclohydrolase
VLRAATHGLDLKGSAVASDAFYPFRDGLDEAAKGGAKSIIQPAARSRTTKSSPPPMNMASR